MRGIGKQQPVSAVQLFDFFRGQVEACRQTSYLIAPFDFDARRKVARPDALDAFLRAFKPAGQPPHQRIGAKSHAEGHDA